MPTVCAISGLKKPLTSSFLYSKTKASLPRRSLCAISNSVYIMCSDHAASSIRRSVVISAVLRNTAVPDYYLELFRFRIGSTH